MKGADFAIFKPSGVFFSSSMIKPSVLEVSAGKALRYGGILEGYTESVIVSRGSNA